MLESILYSLCLPHGFSTSIGLDVYFPVLISNMLAGKLDTPKVVVADGEWWRWINKRMNRHSDPLPVAGKGLRLPKIFLSLKTALEKTIREGNPEEKEKQRSVKKCPSRLMIDETKLYKNITVHTQPLTKKKKYPKKQGDY